MTDFIRMRIGDRMNAGAMAGPALLLVLLAVPWLNPFASGPSSSMGPWLFSAICAAIAFGLQRPGMPHPAGAAALAGLAAWAVWQTGVSPETLALAAACLVVLMAASHRRGRLANAGPRDGIGMAAGCRGQHRDCAVPVFRTR